MGEGLVARLASIAVLRGSGYARLGRPAAMDSVAASRTTAVMVQTTVDVSFDDAPQKPEKLRITLQDRRSLWQKVQESVRDFTPDQLMASLSSERQKILASVREKGSITKEEAEVLNRTTRESIKKTLDDFLEKATKALEITPKDTPEEIELKMGFSEMLATWLSDLFQWLLKKMKEIFQWIREKIEWCWKKTKELFKHLFSVIF